MKPNRWVKLLAIAALLGLPSGAGAYTCTGSTCTPTLSYTEPSTYTSGQPLTDLKDGVYTYQINGGANKTLVIPASKPQGGGTIVNTSIVETIAVCTTSTLTGSLVMRTTTGAVSAAATHPPLVFDRTKLASGAPDPACVTPSPVQNLQLN